MLIKIQEGEKIMPFYSIKEIHYTIVNGGGRTTSSYYGSIGFKNPSSQFEADKMAEEWLKKKYPNGKIIDLKVILR